VLTSACEEYLSPSLVSVCNSAFARTDSYSWNRADLALQWLAYAGSASTVYHAVPQYQTVQLVLRVYL